MLPQARYYDPEACESHPIDPELQRVATPEAILAEARTWLHVPYLHQGRGRGGVDCIGFVQQVFSKFRPMEPILGEHGEAAEYWAAYSPKPNPRLMRMGIGLFFYQVPKSQARHGDVLWMNRLRDNQHAGIYSDNCGRGIIHSISVPGCVVEHGIDDKWWDRKVVGVFRLRGI